MLNQKKYDGYTNLLKEELIPATGCTEPIALAYACAIARKNLGQLPDKIDAEVSGNIIKNVKSVVVPNTGGLKGIEAACAAGTIAGKSDLLLDVISKVSDEEKKEIQDYLNLGIIHFSKLCSDQVLDIIVHAYKDGHQVDVRICTTHTNVVKIVHDGNILFEKEIETVAQKKTFKEEITVDEIWEYTNTVKLEDIETVIDRQIQCNYAIACYGLEHEYGANVGSTLLKQSTSLKEKIKAYAASGSDARMSGCEMPVVVNSGSGNQGMTVSVPVIVYAKEKNKTKEELYRALVLSNLLAIHQKAGIGRLSAFCGVVSAAIGAVCGIAYLDHQERKCIDHIIVNTLAMDSGIVCDGAKPSCAGKIAVSLESAILGYQMYQNGQQFRAGDGIVSKGVENTLKNVCKLAKDGMKETDEEILDIMTKC